MHTVLECRHYILSALGGQLIRVAGIFLATHYSFIHQLQVLTVSDGIRSFAFLAGHDLFSSGSQKRY